MFIQSAVLIVVLLMLDWMLKKRVRAVFRYWVWMLVLLKLVLPVHLALPTSPAYWTQMPVLDVVDSTRTIKSPVVVEAMPVTPASAQVVSSPPKLAPVVDSAEIATPVVSSHAASNHEIYAPVSANASVGLSWQAILFLCWCAAILMISSYIVGRVISLRRLIAASKKPMESLTDCLQDCCKKLGIRRPVDLRVIPTSCSPCVYGLRRPVILFPQDLLEKLNPRQRQSILLHELVHIQRGDLWVSFIQSLLQVVYFFNPFLWLANARIRQAREQAVDETVLVTLDQRAQDYPQTLLDISNLAFDDPLIGMRLIGVVESKKALFKRIQHIATHPCPRSVRLGIVSMLILVGLALTLLPMARAKQNENPISDDMDLVASSLNLDGFVTDSLGRPRQCVIISSQGQSMWRGAESDDRGYFQLENVLSEQRLWMAYSQASRLMGLFQLPESPGEMPLNVVLKYQVADLQGRIVGSDGKGIANQKVEIVVSTPDGLRFSLEHQPKTNASGYYTSSRIPVGKGVKVEAIVTVAQQGTTSYSTGLIPVKARQILVEMPLVMAAAAKIQPDFDQNLGEVGMLRVGGRVVDEQSRPLKGVKVDLSFDMPNYMSTWGRVAVTDDQGKWHCALPKDCQDLTIRGVQHAEYYYRDSYLRPPRIELEKGSHTLAMQRGCVLRGRVVNRENQPVENALIMYEESLGSISAGPQNQIIEEGSRDRTLKDGTFQVTGLPPGRGEFVVYSYDYAPTIQTVDVSMDMPEIDIVVNKGRHYRGRIVSTTGGPLEGVIIGVDEWNPDEKRRDMNRIARTDDRGQFCLSNLPEGRIALSIGKKGHEYIRKDVPDDLTSVDELVMIKTPFVNGFVVDVDTNEPVTEFWMVAGSLESDQSYEWSRYHRQQFKHAQGHFNFSWRGFTSRSARKFQASGYLPTILDGATVEHNGAPVTIRLRKGTPITGTVLQPDGQGAVKAQLALVRTGELAYIDGCQFSERGYAYQAEMSERTDAKACFEIPPTLDQGLLVVVHETGYAQIASSEYANGSDIPLTPWVKIQGTLATPPGETGETVVNVELLKERVDRQVPGIQWLMPSQTPSTQSFQFDYLPEGPMAVSRIHRYEQDNAVFLDAKPGQVYRLDLSDQGASAQGHIIAGEGQTLNSIPFENPRQVHAVAFCLDDHLDVPEEARQLQASSFNRLWQNKEKVAELSQKTRRRFVPTIDKDGGFLFQGLKPGRYAFFVNIHEPLGENVSCGRGVLKAVGVSHFQVTTASESAVPVPDVKLTRLTYPGVGESAPDFEVKTHDNRVLRLSDLKGKVVLLDFWASWCRPCLAQMPKLQSLYQAYSNDDRFVMVGLSLDHDSARAKQAITERQWPWIQALAGSMDESVISKAFGIGSIPAMILIDEQGHILSKTDEADALTQVIEEALGAL